ncbi:dihydrodipicolinate synthase family protein [Inquilinus limosus]|uniref:dihydrodipicolinate synthase family protein n=1 Tax=Inquilinus limosus TaxID=171674 RepID=UPI00047B59C7|nr:dihydrodipicolinate synthase family protein [Inquilinus limosus]
MSQPGERFGLSAALTVPFRPDGHVDFPRLVAHARWCLAHGCRTVTAFGTTGEGAAFSLPEREQVLGAFAGAGIEGRQLVGGIAASSAEEAVAQARLALDFGADALLLPPPFYFKGVGDDGLFAWFARVFEQLGAAARDVILYHIPSVTQVPISVDLVGRLRAAFPEVIRGVKDSSGDWDYAQALLAAHRDLAILIGDERCLAAAVRLGGQGAISGIANIYPEAMLPMVRDGRENDLILRLVEALLAYPVIPAVKALVAHRSGDPTWLATRAPLQPLSPAQAKDLAAVAESLFTARAAAG